VKGGIAIYLFQPRLQSKHKSRPKNLSNSGLPNGLAGGQQMIARPNGSPSLKSQKSEEGLGLQGEVRASEAFPASHLAPFGS
jgi:hypothetical protein